jgi:signal transduction histidine kinase
MTAQHACFRGLLSIGMVLSAAAAGANELQPIAAVRQLGPPEVAANPEVRVRGVVTRVTTHMFFLQDDTDAIYVNMRVARSRGLLGPGAVPADIALGRVVEVEGLLTPAGFAPAILPRSVTVVGTQPLPEPPPADMQRLFTGADDCRRIAVTGIVQDAMQDGQAVRLTVESDGRRLLAELRLDVLEEGTDELVNAVVRLCGPVGALFNTRGEFLMPRLHVERIADLDVVAPPPCPPFESPLEPIESLARFRRDAANSHMLRVRGTVIHAIPGDVVYLQSGANGIRVSTRSEEPLAAGDIVEVAGFLDRSGPVAGLAFGMVKVIGRGPAPEPAAIQPVEILECNAEAADSAVMANPGDYEGCLVRFAATLIEAQQTTDGGVLVLAADRANVTAAVSADAFAALRGIRPGSELLVTAINQIEWSFAPEKWPPRRPERIKAFIRGADDVVVVRQPSWWTPRRLATLAGVTAAVLAGALAWVWLLRRELGVQRKLVAKEIKARHEAAVEVNATLRERNRLAANLHDTLLQTLGGIGYQLDACEGGIGRDSSEAREHFDVARRMVSHATSELHHSVWAMRSLPLGQQTFPEALESMVHRVSDGHAVAITFDLRGPLETVPAFVAGNLLLIMQEAVYNALRHGHPRTIGISATMDPAARIVGVRVEDDGSGFPAEGASGAEQGHFGLQGMRERAERLSGVFRVESGIGRGTTVVAEVPCRDYDAEIDVPG